MNKVAETIKNESRCKCPGCPTWQASDCPKEKNEKLYCARGKTTCNLLEAGCICGSCPIWEENNLSKGYFCLNGRAQ